MWVLGSLDCLKSVFQLEVISIVIFCWLLYDVIMFRVGPRPPSGLARLVWLGNLWAIFCQMSYVVTGPTPETYIFVV